ncbi:MAG: hypothetical protein IPK58_21940 [Acidobacteria bacterium]|nr:hypothetical protein [Acidobacteriota bacterium]
MNSSGTSTFTSSNSSDSSCGIPDSREFQRFQRIPVPEIPENSRIPEIPENSRIPEIPENSRIQENSRDSREFQRFQDSRDSSCQKRPLNRR